MVKVSSIVCVLIFGGLTSAFARQPTNEAAPTTHRGVSAGSDRHDSLDATQKLWVDGALSRFLDGDGAPVKPAD